MCYLIILDYCSNRVLEGNVSTTLTIEEILDKLNLKESQVSYMFSDYEPTREEIKL